MLAEIRNFAAKLSIPDGRFERQAQPVLGDFLNRYTKAVNALRSFAQARERYTDADRELLPELEQAVGRLSDGHLKYYDGFLCVISDTWQVFQEHDGISVGFEKLGKEPSAVKGLYFHVSWESYLFKCVVLDHGLSRQFFDSMSNAEKHAFVRRFGYSFTAELPVPQSEIEWRIDYTRSPKTFTAFLTDRGNSLDIDTIATIRPLRFGFD